MSNSQLGKPGAAARAYLPAYVSKAGHEVAIVADQRGTSEAIVEEQSIEMYSGKWHNSSDRFSFVRSVIHEFAPDIIHVFFHRGCGLYPLLTKKPKGLKWVLDLRSPLLHTGWSARVRRWVNRCEAALFDCICAPHSESARTVIGDGFDVSVIPVGMESSQINERSSYEATPSEAQEPASVKAVYVGSLNANRRLEAMIRSVNVVTKKLPVTLDIYGEGNAQRELETIAQKEGLTDIVRFRGVVPRREIYQGLADYDIGLAYIGNPVHDTGPPLKTLEYLAAGVPVVATDTLGNRMFVEEGANGVLTGRDAESFGEGIVRLAQDPNFEAMSAWARESVVAYDWERIVEDLLIPLYTNLIGESYDPDT